MSLAAGTQLGPYEVMDLLGAGAMGEVYRARDTRLRRTVAVKVLPASMGNDPARLKRFEQEARAAGALNHPNIVAIHDFGHDSGSPYVVSELLEGETLRERMGGTPLSPRKAAEYAIQIARGLAAAHEKGIVHRDLKPDNIFLTRDGGVKILDFGLAKLQRAPFGGSDVFDGSVSAAATCDPLTEEGTVLGTVGYMSPEQVRGQNADHRSDIFSFGAVLYEMLTGQRAFKGRSAVETLNAILKEDPPPITDTAPAPPPAMERIVYHCLEKNPAERFQSAHDLAFDIEALSSHSGASRAALVGESPWQRAKPGLLAALIMALPAAGFLLARATPHHPNPEYQRLTFRRGTVYGARFAPDGQVVYAAAWNGRKPEVYARRPETPDARVLGMERAFPVAISPAGEMAVLINKEDGPSVLARVSLSGGPPREILENVKYADWARDGSDFAVVRWIDGGLRLDYPIGTPLVTSASPAGLSHVRISPKGDLVAFLEHPLVSDDRGSVAIVDRAGRKTILSSDWGSIEGLAWSKDGDEVLFTAAKVGADSALYAVDLSGKRRLVEKAPGRLVLHDVSRDGTLLLERNSHRMEIRGIVDTAAEDVDLSWFDFSGPADLSTDGKSLLFYESGEGGGSSYSVYVRPTDGGLPVRLGDGRAQSLSPDGKSVVSLPLDAPPRMTILPTGAGQMQTISHPSIEHYRWAQWLPDGKKILFSATEPNNPVRLYVHDLETGVMRPATPPGRAGIKSTITPDGKSIIGMDSEGKGHKYFLQPLDGSPATTPLPWIAEGDMPVRWNADGKALYVTHGYRPIQIFRLDAATGARTLVREVEPNDAAGAANMGMIVMTADASAVVYSHHRVLSDLYLVTALDD
jgi:serine/threonine protein kinase/Tol biopolymer transport system component